jgi:hypothetical protein
MLIFLSGDRLGELDFDMLLSGEAVRESNDDDAEIHGDRDR